MNELDLIRGQIQEQYKTQSQLQSEEAANQSQLYAPQLKEQFAETQAAVIRQTNPARALRIIIKGFEGYILNEDGELEQIGEPLMNQRGIAKIASMLIPFINDPTRFGNISSVEVRLLALQIINDITDEIGINWREYGIQDPKQRDLIVDSLMSLIFLTLTRSEGQGEKNWLGRIVLESIQGQKPMQKKESIWSKFKL